MTTIEKRIEAIAHKAAKLPKPSISFEFFPPKTAEGKEKLLNDVPGYAAFAPEYISVTYGAGGSTREATYEIVKHIRTHSQVPPAAHLTCVGATREEVDRVAESYLAIGVDRIVALRGDMPGMVGQYHPHPQGYAYADALVQGLAKLGKFDMSVAAYPQVHPQARSAEDDLHHLRRKIDAGAHRAITQLCFETNTVLDFIKRARASDITKPIVPGILLMNNFKQAVNFATRCGATTPQWVHQLFDGVEPSDPKHLRLAAMIAAEQCITLMEHGIGQFHFYTLDRLDVTQMTCHMLGIHER